MRKQSYFINKEDGFFLPFVMFIISIIFIVITANIATYRNDIHITDNYLEQLKIETLFQMGHGALKEDLENSDKIIDKKSYSFPEGNVEISLISSSDEKFIYDFIISTNKHPHYALIHQMNVPDQIKEKKPPNVYNFQQTP